MKMPKTQRKHQTIQHPLKPLYQKNSKVLILGSFPSIKTREYGFFYGHPQNRFWTLMEKLFNEKLTTKDIVQRKEFLLKNKLALYDSIFQCDIIGSSDASIENVTPSDLSQIFETAHIKQVFCNGNTSYKYYKKYHAKKTGIAGIALPSTSPANARFQLDDLFEQWKKILDYLD